MGYAFPDSQFWTQNIGKVLVNTILRNQSQQLERGPEIVGKLLGYMTDEKLKNPKCSIWIK